MEDCGVELNTKARYAVMAMADLAKHGAVSAVPLSAIAQRQNTLERVATEIVKRQRDYLDFGVSHLKPLKMQEVADALGVSVTTVKTHLGNIYVKTGAGRQADLVKLVAGFSNPFAS